MLRSLIMSSSTFLLLSVFTLALLSFTLAETPTQRKLREQPTKDWGPEWQQYLQVTESLPNVTWTLPRNWAGNLPVQRAGHPNNTLFFWAFESSRGSFTADSQEPWGIWLNGGPGASSLLGLLFENGPIHIQSDYSAVENGHAWTSVADYVWIDQPVGTGFSTADADGLVADEDQLGADFVETVTCWSRAVLMIRQMGFLNNFIKVFPNLAKRPLYIAGESYAGVYIPYITKAYFGIQDPPVNLAGIAIGDGAIASLEDFAEVPAISVLETYPQIIGYDTQVFEYFKRQSQLCGYNLTLQYPQPAHFPSVDAPTYLNGASSFEQRKITKRRFILDVQEGLAAKFAERGKLLGRGERVRACDVWKRDLTGRPNDTIDPWYQCDLYSAITDYAVNFTFPWSHGGLFDAYDIPDALSPEANMDAAVFLNDAKTRAAIHAPNQEWTPFTANYPFAYTNSRSKLRPMAFLSELATNATARNVKIVIYSGNDDSLDPHFGSQRNTTFGGIQGFTRKPSTPWYNDNGEFAGIVHQERGWTYVLVANAGHILPHTNPISAITLAREFIFGNNRTGLVTTTNSGAVTVIGGEESPLKGEILRGQAAIYYGAGTTASSYIFPTATVQAWDAYMATATGIP
ncbi:Alpha/Beta hydrolase protein [Chiua virens]|nr:Alpha/Beta hydrolase protein [Chiua virens]